MSNELTKPQETALAAETTVFHQYLATFGLPTDNVIATDAERRIVATNLPSFLAELSDEDKSEARYLSKFVGATSVGLFDAVDLIRFPGDKMEQQCSGRMDHGEEEKELQRRLQA